MTKTVRLAASKQKRESLNVAFPADILARIRDTAKRERLSAREVVRRLVGQAIGEDVRVRIWRPKEPKE